MSFQITVLKVLAGHPGGRASLDDLRRAVAILISSGSDWTHRTKRLAARAPGLDIFTQAFVLRDEAGWQITHAGTAFLAALEAPMHVAAPIDKAAEPLTQMPPSPEIRLTETKRAAWAAGEPAGGILRSPYDCNSCNPSPPIHPGGFSLRGHANAMAGVAAVLRYANEFENSGEEWPETDTIGSDGWHYQLRQTAASALDALGTVSK